MYKIGEKEMVICPYNRYHVVSKLRIQKHIIKCKEKYPNVKLSTCFYNYYHRLNPEDMLAHYKVCSHKTRVEGARYETDSSTTSARGDQRSKKFPDINVKPHFFDKHFTSSSCSSAQISFENIDKLDSSDSESVKSTFKVEFSDDNDDSDDDLEPLPLPKTISKAFACVKQKSNTPLPETSANTSQSKGFGRAKNFFAWSPSKLPRTTEHLLPDLMSLDCNLPQKKIGFRVFSSNGPSSSSSVSIVSSMFEDDVSIFKSQEIVPDKDKSDRDNFSDLLFNNIDKYTKL